MTPTQVLELVEKIAADPGKLHKETLVKQGMADPFFEQVMVATYNPFMTYGVRNVPTGLAAGEDGWTLDAPHVWVTLDELASRRLTGTAALTHIQYLMDKLDYASATLLWRILRKDMRAGFTDGTINRVAPKTLPEFPYMRCSLPDKSNMPKWDWSDGIISQEKADGMFANVNMDEQGYVWITSRQGTPFPLDGDFNPLVGDVRRILKPGTQTHGELIVYDERGYVLPREQGNGRLNSVIQGGQLPIGHNIVFFAWDQIPLAAVTPKGSDKTGYEQRLMALLKQCMKDRVALVRVIPTMVCRSKAQAYDHYRTLLRQGKEGTICKHPKATWKDGTSKDQVKLKLEVDVDLRITGFVPGEGKNAATFGSLECQTDCGSLLVNVSGFDDKTRAGIWNLRDEQLGRIISVRANGIMAPSKEGKPHSLFLPRFVEFRNDKTKADDLQSVKDQFDNAVAA